mmetsp:Transcript_9126/g.29593  ORF Transcript_9126/g.29593 Transcript_9126/m.29593 type:complete len:212 (+) Transcript_9126:713-1348(+)
MVIETFTRRASLDLGTLATYTRRVGSTFRERAHENALWNHWGKMIHRLTVCRRWHCDRCLVPSSLEDPSKVAGYEVPSYEALRQNRTAAILASFARADRDAPLRLHHYHVLSFSEYVDRHVNKTRLSGHTPRTADDFNDRDYNDVLDTTAPDRFAKNIRRRMRRRRRRNSFGGAVKVVGSPPSPEKKKEPLVLPPNNNYLYGMVDDSLSIK